MKIVRDKLISGYFTSTKEVDVEDAIRGSIEGYSDHGEGSVEVAKRVADNSADMLAKLISILVEKEMLTSNDISSMLSYKFSIEEE
jgi:molybdate-binding protein